MLKFHADSYFTIGSAHTIAGKPCQDHALSASNELTGACAVVSDGCSSGGHTDIGARILTLATMRATSSLNVRGQQKILSDTQALLQLDWRDLLATCAYIILTREGGKISIQGDGVVAVKYRCGDIVAARCDWRNNTPFYPAYLSSGEIQAFYAVHGGKDTPAFSIEKALFTEFAGKWVALNKTCMTAEEGTVGYMHNIGDPSAVDLVAVFSDGVCQVDGMSWQDVVAEFMAMKSLTGEFVKRRMIRAIKDMKTHGKGPVDDISAAMIYIEST